ncbi:hypothetical protein BH09PSE2_BH09PSE2_05640 [soil metagenome]
MAGTLATAAQYLNRLLPFGWRLVNVYSPLAQVARPGPAFALLSPEAALVTLHDGHFLYVDPQDDSVSAHLIARGVWEFWVEQAVRGLVRPGDRIVEVGANVGYFTVLMASLIGPTGRITSFEANPLLAELVRRSLSLNGYLDRVDVRAEAASDTIGVLDFVTCRKSNGGGHILQGGGDFGTDTIHVRAPSTTLDEAFPTGSVDLIRIDAEGAEPLVFRGARGLIARSPNLRICMEWDVVQMGARVPIPELIALFQEEGFRFWRIKKDFGLEEVKPGDLAALPHSDLVLSRQAPPLRS